MKMTRSEHETSEGPKCPFMKSSSSSSLTKPSLPPASAQHRWWPNQLDLRILERRDNKTTDPSSSLSSTYASRFLSLNLLVVKADLLKVLTTSVKWWPADYGHYGPLMVRMAWHSSGTYRISDGRGGASSGGLRFAPLNSWPDNANLDKARRLLWPVKRKYGNSISWADLMILAGNVSLESMGFRTFGFAGGREDVYYPEDNIYWGPEKEWLADQRHTGAGNGINIENNTRGKDNMDDRKLADPLGATQMGLVYVNPEGPNGTPDPLLAARDIRTTFGRMGMNDYETVALVAGGHTFGKSHGAAVPTGNVGPSPEGSTISDMGLGWANSYGSGRGEHTITSGLEGAWTKNPVKWDDGFFHNLLGRGFRWVRTKGPGGAVQWTPEGDAGSEDVPDAHKPSIRHAPMMLTTDIALITDPLYVPISARFHEKPTELADAFARAWYKLTHRDMGPITRYLGNEFPKAQIWQDPVPEAVYPLINELNTENLKQRILQSCLTVPELVNTAWASASTFRCTDRRGGANGARIRLSPQRDWRANDPTQLSLVLKTLGSIRDDFNHHHRSGVSLADMIVLGGCAAIEEAARRGGVKILVPFSPGRTDATPEQTDEQSFDVLEPTADGFRNYIDANVIDLRSLEERLVDRSTMLTLTASEMTVLVGGMRVLDANTKNSSLGVWTERPGTLSNDFFTNLLDVHTTWNPLKENDTEFEGRDDLTKKLKWKGSRVDLIFGSNSQLRSLSEYYACDDSNRLFISDFVNAWVKVMNLDRYDLQKKTVSIKLQSKM